MITLGAPGLGGPPDVAIGAITTRQSCKLYEFAWGAFLVRECETRFSAPKAS